MYTKIAPRNRSKKLRTVTKHNTFLGFFIAIGFIIAYTLASTSDYKYAQLQQASATCQYQLYNSTPTFDECMNNQLERNNDK